MKPPLSSENDERDEEIIKRLRDLGSFEPTYPPALLSARRAAFLAQVERLKRTDVEEELDPRDEEIVKLLGQLKSAKVEYPADLLAARRSAFLQQIERARTISLLDQLRLSIKRIFEFQIPRLPPATR